jgi:hypothetical protein
VAGLIASFPGTIENPELEELESGPSFGHWIVTVYNNDHNTYEEVITILMIATGCDLDEASIETWEIDNIGRSVVHHGREDECRDAAEIIGQIGIRVEVSEE